MPTFSASLTCQPVIVEQLGANDLPHYNPRTLTISNLSLFLNLPFDNYLMAGRCYHRIASTQTIDLTNISDPIYGTLNFSGKKMAGLVLRNTGTASASLAQGATDGYPLPTGSITVPPDGYVFAVFLGQGSAVSSTSKTLTANITTGAVLECLLIFID